LILAYYLKKII
jgi:hypothetical protein